MTPQNLIDQARQRGVDLWADGTALRWRCTGALPADLRDALTAHKAALLALLSTQAANAPPTAMDPGTTAAINRWLDAVGEDCRLTRAQVLARAAESPSALAGLLTLAARHGITPAPLFAPARTCGTCAHWREDRPHIGTCDRGRRPSSPAGWWDSDPRECDEWEGRP